MLVEDLARKQAARKTKQKGPPVSVAFDGDGNITAAGQAFARKCGVDPSRLGRTKNDKGEWLSCDVVEAGSPARELMPELIEKAATGDDEAVFKAVLIDPSCMQTDVLASRISTAVFHKGNLGHQFTGTRNLVGVPNIPPEFSQLSGRTIYHRHRSLKTAYPGTLFLLAAARIKM